MEHLWREKKTITTPLYDFRHYLVTGGQEVPRLPYVVQQILACSQNAQANAKKLATIITTDAVISAQILKTVNSAYYGFPKQITSIKHAVVLIGFQEVSNLAIGLSLSSLLEGNNSEPFYRDFRAHALGTANFALLLAKKFSYHDISTAYTGGLLHDFGMLMLFSWQPKIYQQIISLSLTEKQSLTDSEKQMIGFDHLEAGKLVGHLWHLPEQLLLCMQCHNSIKTTPDQENILLALIDLANLLAHQAGFPVTAGIPAPKLTRTTWLALQKQLPGLKKTMLQAWIDDITPAISKILTTAQKQVLSPNGKHF